MERKEAEQKQITIYWWNLGSKQLDFKGTYKDFLAQKGIKISNISFPIDKKTKGLRFKLSLSTTFTIDSYDSDIINAFNIAITTYLNYLGDKALFIDGYGRTNKLNWR